MGLSVISFLFTEVMTIHCSSLFLLPHLTGLISAIQLQFNCILSTNFHVHHGCCERISVLRAERAALGRPFFISLFHGCCFWDRIVG